MSVSAASPAPALRADDVFASSAVLDCLTDGVMVTDVDPLDPRIVYVNAALQEITGYGADELLGASPRILQGPATDRGLLDRLKDDLAVGRQFCGQATNYRKDGTAFEMEWTISTLSGHDGEPAWYVAVQRDATLPSRRLLKAEREARVDALTGLPNRRHCDDVISRGGWLSSRARSAIVIDLDRFKSINDTHGHTVGDEVLREVGRRLLEVVGDNDLVARWGGEEFCVLTLDGSRSAPGLGERLRAAIADAPFATSAGPLAVTASVGCAQLGTGSDDACSLFSAADAALYEAKRGGRNRVCVA